jgi:hypothetical protein
MRSPMNSLLAYRRFPEMAEKHRKVFGGKVIRSAIAVFGFTADRRN